MTLTVHRQLYLFTPLADYTIFEFVLLCVEPTHRDRYADLFNFRLQAELCIATYNMVSVFESGTSLSGRSVVSLAATTPCRLRPFTLLGNLDIHCICNIPRSAISTSSLLCNVQNTIDTSVCLQIMLNNNGT